MTLVIAHRGASADERENTLPPSNGRSPTAIATDNSHHPGFDSGFAWTWLRVAERSREGVLAALRDGALYVRLEVTDTAGRSAWTGPFRT